MSADSTDPLGPAEVGPRDHCIAVAVHREVRHLVQDQLDRLGKPPLVAAHRLDVAQRHREGGHILV